jgi:DNA-directed RNA polymerase specialized sigma24 family protein
METGVLDPVRCEALAQGAAGGDPAAWQALIGHLWPALFRIVQRHRSMGPLARSDDQVRDVLSKVVVKLGGTGGRGLALYAPWRARHPDKTFEDWIRIVTANVVRDHVREMMGDAAAFELPSATRLLNEFAASPALAAMAPPTAIGVRPPITNAQTARELFEFARKRLPAEQMRALELWVAGASHDEIGAELGGVDEEVAARLVRSAVAVLRRAFANAG